MLKVFRRIRQRLLSENRFSRYMIYAIGEIVLVVIGILIALSINSWNQDRLEAKKETAYLSNIEADLRQQLVYIDLQLEHELKHDTIVKRMLDRYRKEEILAIDSLASSQLYELTIRKTFTKADPTYQDLISTGNIGLIEEESLRNELLSYYLELERIASIMMINNTLYVDEMFAMKMVHHVFLTDSAGSSTTDQRLLEASNQKLKDPEEEMLVINLIKIRASISEGHIQFMNELKEKTEAMLKSIEE